MTMIRYLLVLAIVFLPASPFATTFPVTKVADTDDGTCDADCSLREAIGAANGNPGADDVPVPAGTYLLTLGELVVSDDAKIAGTDQASTIVSGNGSSRVFKIDSAAVVGIEGVTIQGGYASYFAGGIWNRGGDLTLTNSTVRNNGLWAGNYGHVGTGGGIVSSGALTLINTTVTGHWVAEYGGAIDAGGTLTLINSTISGNEAFRGGGGIRNFGNLALTNSTVSRNHTYLLGGGVLNYGDMTLTSSTVSENDAQIGSGINNLGVAALAGSIVAANSESGCAGVIHSLGNNLSDDDSCGLAAPGDLVVADAMLGPLSDNGGLTKTHALLPGSPAIDAGGLDCPPPHTDQRGVARPQDAACDIGAVEFVLAATLVEIDIQPNSDSNRVRLSGHPPISVAIFGSNAVDVLDIDVASLVFGPAGAAPKHDLGSSKVANRHLRDLNRDGFTDLVTHFLTQQTGISPDDTDACLTGEILGGARFEACNAIEVIARIPEPLFPNSTRVAVGDGPSSVVADDLDGDSLSDLVTADRLGQTVSVLLNNGEGSFQAATAFPTSGSPWSLDVADLDGDSIPDIVTGDWGTHAVTVLLGNGDGSFEPAGVFPTGEFPRDVTASDFDGDGDPDLVTAHFSTDTVSVLLGNGDGSFEAPVFFPAGDGPIAVTAADLDGDAIPDLATANAERDAVGVLLGNGDGSFGLPAFFPAGTYPLSIAAADFNGDGVPDLASGSFGHRLSVLLGNGDGSFQVATAFAAGGSPSSLAVADFDRDRALDIATAFGGGGSVLRGSRDGSFEVAEVLETGGGGSSVTSADFDDDGAPDLAFANYGDDDVSVLLNASRTGRTPQARRGRH